jgi:hypothetical protein
MAPISTHPVLATVASALLVSAAAYLSVADNVPSVRAPFSLVAVVPALVVYEWGQGALGRSAVAEATWTALATLPAGGAFLAWSYPLLLGRDRVPRRSAILAVVAALLTVVFFVHVWSYGLTYHGGVQTVGMAVYNVVGSCIVFWCFRRNRASPSYASNLAFHVALFLWLAYCAFPWLGELI